MCALFNVFAVVWMSYSCLCGLDLTQLSLSLILGPGRDLQREGTFEEQVDANHYLRSELRTGPGTLTHENISYWRQRVTWSSLLSMV